MCHLPCGLRAALLLLALAPSGRAAGTGEDRIVEMIEDLGGTVARDDKAPGKPVVSVNLQSAAVTADTLKRLAGLEGLRVLRLWDAPVTDAMLGEVKALGRLEKLDLDGTRITDAGLAHLAGLKSLRELSLWRVGITDAGMKA